jgi:hypothetical protein
MRKVDLEDMSALIDFPIETRISAPQIVGRGYRSCENTKCRCPIRSPSLRSNAIYCARVELSAFCR